MTGQIVIGPGATSADAGMKINDWNFVGRTLNMKNINSLASGMRRENIEFSRFQDQLTNR